MESLGLRRSVRSLVTASLLMAALAFLMECQNPTGSQDTRPRIAAIVLVPTNVSKPPLLPARDTICFLDTLKYQAIPYDSQGTRSPSPGVTQCIGGNIRAMEPFSQQLT